VGDVCGIKLVMIEPFHYEQCNFRLQRLFFLLPTGGTHSSEQEGLRCLKKKYTHMPYPCATRKTRSAIQQNGNVFMDSGRMNRCHMLVQRKNQL